MRPTFVLTTAFFAAMLAGQALATEHVISQKGRAFAPKKLVVQQGDSVKFVNEDPYAHNVMDKPGTVEVECAVHPDMKLTIEVRK
jgi:plastocyanin